MAAVFELPLADEQLSDDEVARITGTPLRPRQIEWLEDNGWPYFVSNGGRPVVGRLAARLKLCGVEPSTMITGAGWAPDLSKVR